MIIHGLAVALGLIAVLLILRDGFDYALIPAKPARYGQPSRVLVHRLWWHTRRVARWVRSDRWQESLFVWFGPLALVATFAFWAVGLVLAFGLVQWGLEARLHDEFSHASLFEYLYFSGVTFFTLGYGDIVPLSVAGRLISVLEVGIGFSFLAMLIGYFPVLSQAYAAREVEVVKLAVRADTPPTAARLARAGPADGFATLCRYFEQWESWAAAVYQSHIAYPVLGFYRSQWAGHSWLAAMTAMLDTAALMLTVVITRDHHAARTLFTMVRHFIVELSDIYGLHRTPFRHGGEGDRITLEQLDQLLKRLAENGFELDASADALRRFQNLRETYEPYLAALGHHFCLDLPPIQTSEPLSP